MNFHSDPSKKDFLLPLKRDAALWCWSPGVDSKEIVEAMLAAKYVNERAAAQALADEAWSNRTQVGSLIQQEGLTKRLTSVLELNKRFAQLCAQGSPRVIIKKDTFEPISDKDFEKEVSGEVVFGGVSKRGDPLFLPAKQAWLESYDKANFEKVVFTSHSIAENKCNLFQGFGVSPQPKNHELILQHILNVLCNRNAKTYTDFLDLLAWQVQNIGKPSRIIVALKSTSHQTGKTLFLTEVLGKIYGPSGFVTSDFDKIVGRFNSSLRGKAFVCLEEAVFSKSKKDSDTLKSLSTINETLIEAKFLDPIMTPIGLNFFLTTNHDACAYIENKDKRYWILDVSDHRQGDQPYFGALVEEAQNGGAASFLHYLLHRDISNFVPWRDIDMDNDAKLDMIEINYNPCSSYIWLRESSAIGAWLGSRCIDAPTNIDWCSTVELPIARLYEWYQTWASSRKSVFHSPDNQQAFYKTLYIAEMISSMDISESTVKLCDSKAVWQRIKQAFKERLFT